MNTEFIISVLFFVIAFVFSMLGMGGSQLYIPILYWFGLDFKTEAIPPGMLLNCVNSITASITYIRKKMVVWKIALPFGIMMTIFAPIGAAVNTGISSAPIIIVFALFTASAGIFMIIRQ